MELSETTFIIGVISGITASIIVLLATWLVTRILIPKIRGILLKVPDTSGVLKVPDISGEWESLSIERIRSPKPIKRRFEIKQRGICISAKLFRQHPQKNILYEGTFQSGQLVLNCKEQGGKGHTGGALVLQMLKNKKTLSGKELCFHNNTGQVVCSNQRFTKC